MDKINEVIPIYKKEDESYIILFEDIERLKRLVSSSCYELINPLGYIFVFGLNICKINIYPDRLPKDLIKILPSSELIPTIRVHMSKFMKEYLRDHKFVDLKSLNSDFTESVLSLFIEKVHENKSSRYEEDVSKGVSYVFIEDYGLKLTIYNNEFRFRLEVVDLNTFVNKLDLYIDESDKSVYRFVELISVLFKQPIISKLVDINRSYKSGEIW